MSSALEDLLKRFRMTPGAPLAGSPDVFIDFEPRRELFFLILKNNSSTAATNLRVDFNKALTGLIGNDDPEKFPERFRDLSQINLFKNLTYLAPGREFRVFVDRTDVFLARLGEDLRVSVEIRFQNENGKNFRKIIHHDLSIYLDLPYVVDDE